jgi:hypothetical protein
MKIKILSIILIFLVILGYQANASGIAGTVIDAETEQPIEGAVVFVEWTRTVGGWTGLGYKKTYKIVERITQKDGKFNVLGSINPFVNSPKMVVYKKGYVAWRNDFIFPSYEKRPDFEQGEKYVVKLEPFKKYSHSKHLLFFSGDLSLDESSKLRQAYLWEDILASREEELARKKWSRKPYEYDQKGLWQEVIDELYSR